jgi:hypothetical protein
MAQELKASLLGSKPDISVHEFIAGLGGKDVTDDTIAWIVEQAMKAREPEGIKWIGLLE